MCVLQIMNQVTEIRKIGGFESYYIMLPAGISWFISEASSGSSMWAGIQAGLELGAILD
jgi:hypothetical protein